MRVLDSRPLVALSWGIAFLAITLVYVDFSMFNDWLPPPYPTARASVWLCRSSLRCHQVFQISIALIAFFGVLTAVVAFRFGSVRALLHCAIPLAVLLLIVVPYGSFYARKVLHTVVTQIVRSIA